MSQNQTLPTMEENIPEDMASSAISWVYCPYAFLPWHPQPSPSFVWKKMPENMFV